MSDLLYRLRALFRRKSVEAELDEELRAHLEHQVHRYVQSGLPLEESKRRARLEFGGLDQVYPTGVAAFLFHLIQPAEFQLRPPFRLLER